MWIGKDQQMQEPAIVERQPRRDPKRRLDLLQLAEHEEEGGGEGSGARWTRASTR